MQDIKLDSFQQPIVNTKTKTEQNGQKDSVDTSNKINNILNYFNQTEKEIVINLMKKEKSKKYVTKKKQNKKSDTLIEGSKYEEMLKRLLDQKKIKRFGPKRRETVRKEDRIKTLVNEILQENKEDIKSKIYSSKKETSDTQSSIIIKKNIGFQSRLSFNIDRNAMLRNNITKSKISNNKIN
jgi:hypothetical protein